MAKIPVTTSTQAAARDNAAIAAGTPSFDLMVRAGTAAAATILRDHASRLAHGVAIFAGAGNNGGDAYIVAAQLLRAGVRVRLHAASPPRTPDAIRAAVTVVERLVHGEPTGAERLAIDGLLGTGHSGNLRESIATACERLAFLRDGGATIVALDLPSGLDATSGDVAQGSVPADVTLSFGTIKRGHLIARHHIGRLLVLDIGLAGHAQQDDGAWNFIDARSLRPSLPVVPWNTWKTRQGVVGLVGGNAGMAGAIVLAARSALAAGAGMVHAVVHEQSRAAVQAGVVQALGHVYEERFDTGRCDAIGVGPGLGRTDASQALLQEHLESQASSIVLDADALTLIAMKAREHSLPAAALLAQHAHDGRQIICTPHVGEFARLVDSDLPNALEGRVELARSFAITSRSTTLLKGTPTIICPSDGTPPFAVATGTPALATGGSGDLLTGIVVALLAQGVEAKHAAAVAAWIQGRSAEIASEARGTVRGVGLDSVIDSMSAAWREIEQPASFPLYALADLPPVSRSQA